MKVLVLCPQQASEKVDDFRYEVAMRVFAERVKLGKPYTEEEKKKLGEALEAAFGAIPLWELPAATERVQ